MPRLPAALALGAALLAAVGCNPRYVETKDQVDVFLANGRPGSACVALEMKANEKRELRAYAAEKLATLAEGEQVATDCLCKALYDPETGAWDRAVLGGLDKVARDDLAQCILPALDQPTIVGEERVELVRLLGGMGAPAVFPKLASIAATDADEAVRAEAVTALTQARDEQLPVLLDRLANDASAVVRVAAAESLNRIEDKQAVAAIVKAATDDADGAVRATALKAVVKLKLPETDALVCKAMMDDPSEEVRIRAITSFKGTKRSEALACLKKRLYADEESPAVRTAVMKAIYASPSDEAAKILCDAIGPFLRKYVTTQIAENMDGVDIVTHQNNRDPDNSYACVAKALSQGGYSCYARNHLGRWFNRLGGKASEPWCPGMVRR